MIGMVIGGSKASSRMMFGSIAVLRIVRGLEPSLLRLNRGRQPLRAGQREVDGEGGPPDAAGGDRRGAEHNRGAGTCVRSENGLFVVVIVGAVVMLLGDSPLAPSPYPATMTATAAPLNNVIAALPLLFVIL
jgi:hypothetical protein